MIKQLTLVLSLALAATIASAQTDQYSYNFTAPAGAISCAHTYPYLQYYDSVENSTPPYPGGLPYPNGTFHMPPMPNHPLPTPVANVCANYMAGFVSANGYTAKLELGGATGNQGGYLRIFAPNGAPSQVIEVANAIWTWPATYPMEGESVAFNMTAQIINVCTDICRAASGQLNFISHFHFNWKVFPPSGGGCRSNCTQIAKDWTDDDAEVDGLSTVAILDEDTNRAPVITAEFRLPSWLRWLFGASEPVEIFF